MQQQLTERYEGAFLALACGDALGCTTKFLRPGRFKPLTDLLGGGTFCLQAGSHTDDTAMALCMAESLVAEEGFHPIAFLKCLLQWWRHGHQSSTGQCFDIGSTTSVALSAFAQTGMPWCGKVRPRSAGNGALVRLPPLVMAFINEPERVLELAEKAICTTHSHPLCISAGRIYAKLLQEVYSGTSLRQALLPEVLLLATPGTDEFSQDLRGMIMALPTTPRESIRGSGYVLESLQAVLWVLQNTESLPEALLASVNFGEDATTTAALVGAVAGASYGKNALPIHWQQRLLAREKVIDYANKLALLATRYSSSSSLGSREPAITTNRSSS